MLSASGSVIMVPEEGHPALILAHSLAGSQSVPRPQLWQKQSYP